MPSLTIITGSQAGTTFELASRTLSIGRDPARDMQIIDPRVSRKHAVIRLLDAGHAITPTKAKNGVLINSREIEGEVTLSDGDEITLGETVLRFSLETNVEATNAVHHRKVADTQARDANTIR